MPLTVPQRTIADSPARFKVLISGRRFGKTHLAIRELCKMAAKKPGSICWAICPSYRMAKQIWWIQLKSKLHDLRWVEKSNEAELTITLKNGSLIALKGADNFDSLRGVGLDLVIFDEFQDVPKEAWSEVIRPTLSDKQGSALFCGTPRGVGSFSHELYTKALTEQDWAAFQYTTIEGGNVPIEEIEAAKRDLDERTFLAEYCASFLTYSGTVYYNFDYQRNVIKIPEIDQGVINVGMDFNYDPMCAIIAQIKGEHIHIYDELHIKGSNTEEVCDELRRRYPYSKINVFPDPAARQKRTSAGGKTDYSILVNNNFTVRARNFHTPVRDRVNAVNAKLKNAAGLTSLTVDPKCRHTIDSLQRLTYKEQTNQIDKESGLDHQSDCVGYLVDYLFPIKTRVEQVEPQRWTFSTVRKK